MLVLWRRVSALRSDYRSIGCQTVEYDLCFDIGARTASEQGFKHN